VFNGSFLYSGVNDLQIESRLNLFLILLHACRHIDSILQFRVLAPPLSKVKSTQTESPSAQVRLSESKPLQLFLSPTHYVTPDVNSCLYYESQRECTTERGIMYYHSLPFLMRVRFSPSKAELAAR
jgi:hypothetical protein